jgi:hypothetical protein
MAVMQITQELGNASTFCNENYLEYTDNIGLCYARVMGIECN